MSGGPRWLDRVLGARRIHCLHIGKTGGTALQLALRRAQTRRLRFLLHPHEIGLADLPEGEPVVAFVRDPVTRFVSGFLSRQRQGRPRFHWPWTDAEADAFARFESADSLARALSAGDAGTRAAAERAMRAIFHVRSRLADWFGDETVLRSRFADLLFVGAQEQLEGDVDRLAKTLGVAIALPADPVAAHRTPAGLDRGLSDESIANLRRWYRDDYRCLAVLRERFAHLPDYSPRGGS